MNSNTYLADFSEFDDCGYYIGNTGKFFCSPGKKIKNVYHLIYSVDNLALAQYKAQQGKGERSEITNFRNDLNKNLTDLYWMLRDETYKTGKYRIKKIYDPKERDIMIAPFFPDRIVHHCVINILGRYWNNLYIESTYACIKGRGTHKCMEDVHKALITDKSGTRYCLKIDIRKFYDHVDHDALKRIIRYTIADEQLLGLLDKIIDSNGKKIGLPIGNYTSQYLANLYLAYFDHWMKEYLSVKYYFRYMDDIVVLSDCKDYLHQLLDKMALYLGTELKLEIKHNWQIFPVDIRGIDYVGFKQNHYGILLRSGILKRFYSKLLRVQRENKIKDENDIKHLFPSEYGWIIRCSEEHSKFIFKQCLNNECKCIKNRTTG